MEKANHLWSAAQMRACLRIKKADKIPKNKDRPGLKPWPVSYFWELSVFCNKKGATLDEGGTQRYVCKYNSMKRQEFKYSCRFLIKLLMRLFVVN